MEPAGDLLARPLPHLLHDGGMKIPDIVMVKLLNPEQPNRETTVFAVVGDMATCWTQLVKEIVR